ncbi:MAG: hypothetical protein NTZ80_04520 [Patescibacteria group bacterium]|nr:hypothetical protein [Patescibacteria group bacterium]
MKTCLNCQSQFEITQDDLLFYDKVSPTFNGKKYQIPEPKLCPECRSRRRTCFRNERSLYYRKSDYTGKKIVAMYTPDNIGRVFEPDVWHSDAWDGLDYGCDFDFNKPFFDQFAELLVQVPKKSLSVTGNENSDFVNYSAWDKNCYLAIASGNNEDCYLGTSMDYCKNSMDSLYLRGSEFCYECVDCLKCYSLFFSQDCEGCNDSMFLFNCNNCSSCIGSSNLRNKKFFYFNEQLNQVEYEKKKQEMIGSFSYSSINKWKNLFNNLNKKIPKKYAHIENSEDVSGDFIFNSKNVYDSFVVHEGRDCKYCYSKVVRVRDCYDLNDWGDRGELLYECVTVGKDAYSCLFCANCWPHCSMIIYCDSCMSSSNLFGCAGLRNNEYCILNKQYTKEEYNSLAVKIIDHMVKTNEWGEFFNPQLSSFGYHETVAGEYYPMSREEALKNGFKWCDYEAPRPSVDKIIFPGELPDSIDEVSDGILNSAIECEMTKKPFRIIRQELDFYRKHNLPLPRRHPDQRHKDRAALRNPRKLWLRKCDNCGVELKTSYAPDRPETVYCEKCYLETVY